MKKFSFLKNKNIIQNNGKVLMTSTGKSTSSEVLPFFKPGLPNPV